MAGAVGAFKPIIEDYSTANTADIVSTGVHRWFNNYLPDDPDLVVFVVGQNNTSIAALKKQSVLPTDTVITASQSVPAAGPNHTVFADTDAAAGDIELTIEDASDLNDRITVVNTGAFSVLLTLSGLADESVPAGEARAYVWDGTRYILASGGGGAGGETVINGNINVGQLVWDASDGAVPYDKILAVGTFLEPSSYPALFARYGYKWGQSGELFGTPDMRGIHPGMVGTQDINGNTKGFPDANIGDYIEDQGELITGSTNNLIALGAVNVDGAFESVTQASSAIGGSNTANMLSLDFDSSLVARTGAFTDVSQAMGRWLIQAFDTVQEIPADPGLIKDWVEKFYDYANTGNVPNRWGSGRYWFILRRSDNLVSSTNMVQVNIEEGTVTGYNQGQNTVGATIARIEYNFSTGEFFTNSTGTFYIAEIHRWEDVAGADAQLNPPVDGWETVFDDPANIGPVPNTTGVGFYQIYITGFSGANDCNVTVLVDNLNVTTWSSSVSTGSSSTAFVLIKHDATSQFIIDDAGAWISGEITKIRKFNSLVNVVHSYNPDPRSVAQKDWVSVLPYDADSTALTVANSWGTGKYIFTLKTSAESSTYTALIELKDLSINGFGTLTSPSGSESSNGTVIKYLTASNEFVTIESVTGTVYIIGIEKWQDSQANDAPRNVLDDGWEQLDIIPGETVANQWGIGKYELTVIRTGDPVNYTVEVSVDTSAEHNNSPTFFTAGTTYATMQYNKTDNLFKEIGNISGSAITILSMRKFSGLLRISASYNLTSLSDGPNQVKALNTDAGDVDAGMPSAPTMGDLFEVWNTGTNGNHVTGLPDSITLGDGKGIRLRYVDGWKYEDVIIDEYESAVTVTAATSATGYITKWSGGKMSLLVSIDSNGESAVSIVTPPEPFIGVVRQAGGVPSPATASGRTIMNRPDNGGDFGTQMWNTGNDTSQGGDYWVNYEGRWK